MDEAARECDRAIAADLTNMMFRSCALAYDGAGDQKRAIATVQQLDPGTQWAHLILGWIQLRPERREAALEQFQGLNDARGEFMRACLTGRPLAAAAEDFQRLADRINDPEFRWLDATMLSYCGQTGLAIPMMRYGLPAITAVIQRSTATRCSQRCAASRNTPSCALQRWSARNAFSPSVAPILEYSGCRVAVTSL